MTGLAFTTAMALTGCQRIGGIVGPVTGYPETETPKHFRCDGEHSEGTPQDMIVPGVNLGILCDEGTSWGRLTITTDVEARFTLSAPGNSVDPTIRAAVAILDPAGEELEQLDDVNPSVELSLSPGVYKFAATALDPENFLTAAFWVEAELIE